MWQLGCRHQFALEDALAPAQADASRIRLAMKYREPEAHPPLPSCQLAECRSFLGRVLNLRSVNTLFFNKSSRFQPFLISWQNLAMRQEAPKEID